MQNEIIINADLGETRVAIVERSQFTELHIERDRDRGVVGNVVKGRVSRVLPGMQAAFVDIGLDKAAFLYADVPGHLHILVRTPTASVRLGVCSPGEVWMLQKALCGLRVAPRCWGIERDQQLQKREQEWETQKTAQNTQAPQALQHQDNYLKPENVQHKQQLSEQQLQATIPS